ncbi:hypothetical protein Fmac_015625 [Flemingia macrophylla]|uniref:Uncharacterized protein n=1 Tax=Flemingia macrophylla TaxID=520843 RepID=A0ABD1MFP1_9FABA
MQAVKDTYEDDDNQEELVAASQELDANPTEFLNQIEDNLLLEKTLGKSCWIGAKVSPIERLSLSSNDLGNGVSLELHLRGNSIGDEGTRSLVISYLIYCFIVLEPMYIIVCGRMAKMYLTSSISSKYGISHVGKELMTGVLHHLPSILAIIAPLPNSNITALKNGELILETATSADGSFLAGPLYIDIGYNVKASKAVISNNKGGEHSSAAREEHLLQEDPSNLLSIFLVVL